MRSGIPLVPNPLDDEFQGTLDPWCALGQFIEPYVARRLQPRMATEFELHLLHCEHCQRAVEFEVHVKRVISDSVQISRSWH